MNLEELTQTGWGDAADYFGETAEKYSTSQLEVPAGFKLQTDDDAAAPAPKTFGELKKCHVIVPRMSLMPQVTPRPGNSLTSLGSGKAQSDTGIASLAPAAAPDSSHIRNAKHVEPVSIYHCLLPPHLSTR